MKGYYVAYIRQRWLGVSVPNLQTFFRFSRPGCFRFPQPHGNGKAREWSAVNLQHLTMLSFLLAYGTQHRVVLFSLAALTVKVAFQQLSSHRLVPKY